MPDKIIQFDNLLEGHVSCGSFQAVGMDSGVISVDSATGDPFHLESHRLGAQPIQSFALQCVIAILL